MTGVQTCALPICRRVIFNGPYLGSQYTLNVIVRTLSPCFLQLNPSAPILVLIAGLTGGSDARYVCVHDDILRAMGGKTGFAYYKQGMRAAAVVVR